MVPTYDDKGKVKGYVASSSGKKSKSVLESMLRLDSTSTLRTPYLRLVSQEKDKSARPEVTLLIGLAMDGQKSARPIAKSHLLDQDIRATYTLPCCNAKENKCQVRKTIPLARGKRFGVGIRVLRTAATYEVVDANKSAFSIALESNAVVKPIHVFTHFNGYLRQVFAQAQISFEINRLEVCDPPSDMLAIGDWNGQVLNANHLPENGKPTSQESHVQFDVVWQRPDVPELTKSVGPIDIARGMSPVQVAILLRTTIQHAFPDAEGFAVTVSENPMQTNATGKSCDLILNPPVGRMLMKNLQGATDPAQPIHVISIPVKDRLPILSNFPESYHIGSPHMRCLVKSYSWTDKEQIKVVFASRSSLQVASTGGLVEAFGLGSMRDFSHMEPLGVMQNVVIAGLAALNQKQIIPHEIGHVLIDSGAHALSDSQLMFIRPTSAETPRISGQLPPAANWEYFFPGLDGVTPDFIRGVLGYTSVPMNAVARINKREGALGTPDPPVVVPFTPLRTEVLTAVKTKIEAFLTKLVLDETPVVADIVLNANYVPVRKAKLYAWDNYRKAFEKEKESEDAGLRDVIRDALLEAKDVGSNPIKYYISQATPKDDENLFAQLLLNSTDDEFWYGFVENCPNAMILVNAKVPLEGFRGVVLGNPAMFLSVEDYGQPGRIEPSGKRTQPGTDINRHCYTLMHESLHFYAYQGKGFHHDSAATQPGASDAWKTVLDEGATELFTRLLLYYSERDQSFCALPERPKICYFGLAPDFLPIYEVAKNVVAQMAKDVGLNLLADAYFCGKFEDFFKALANFQVGNKKRYTEEFWRAFSKLSYLVRPYLTPSSPECAAVDAIRRIRSADITPAPTLLITRPTEVIEQWKDKDRLYEDPAKQLMTALD